MVKKKAKKKAKKKVVIKKWVRRKKIIKENPDMATKEEKLTLTHGRNRAVAPPQFIHGQAEKEASEAKRKKSEAKRIAAKAKKLAKKKPAKKAVKKKSK